MSDYLSIFYIDLFFFLSPEHDQQQNSLEAEI